MSVPGKSSWCVIAKSCMTLQRTLPKKARRPASWQIPFTPIFTAPALERENEFRSLLPTLAAVRSKDGCVRCSRKSTSTVTGSSAGWVVWMKSATCTWIFVPAWRKKPAQNRSQIRRRKHRRERDDAETGRSMMGVPKIVLGRLRRASNPGNHPGADLLTAFAEQALAKRERLHVLEHLAQCSECREIVSLARPEIAEPQTSLKLFSLRSPVLRWGALMACVVVVGAVVTTRHLAQKNVETCVTAKAPFSDTKDASQGVDLKTDLTAKLQPQPLAKQDSVVSHGLARQRVPA